MPQGETHVPPRDRKTRREPISDPAGEPPHGPTEGVERPRPRPSNDPDVVGPRDGLEERRPRTAPVI